MCVVVIFPICILFNSKHYNVRGGGAANSTVIITRTHARTRRPIFCVDTRIIIYIENYDKYLFNESVRRGWMCDAPKRIIIMIIKNIKK